MKVLIVAKTRQGSAACIGGITFEGRSVRLVSPSPDDRWGLDFEVGEVWEIECETSHALIPPHNENIVVRSRRKMGNMLNTVAFIERHMPPVYGEPTALYQGFVQRRPNGALYVAESTGVPTFSTQFWRPDKPLCLDATSKRLRYRCRDAGQSSSLVFVGFQHPPERIAEGTLIRVSLAHWWRPEDRPSEPLRCFVQLSGWFDQSKDARTAPAVKPSASPESVPQSTPDLSNALAMMEKTFGFRSFRPIQEQIVRNVILGKDTLGIMPTGAGKSLCYQIPALIKDGLTVVVSPLISLMQDQIDQLRSAGVTAVTLNSNIAYAEFVSNAEKVRSGASKILYLAPETLLRPETLVLLKEARVRHFAIDEAHCISEWGHDFRPDYRQIQGARAGFPNAVCIALTATATDRVRGDIQRLLSISSESTFIAEFDRPNLFLSALRRRKGIDQILEFLADRHDQRGIIYCTTREQVDRLCEQLLENGVSALPYHAGMADSDRRQNQRKFQHDQVDVIVATIAFGMGINKPDVRFVLHSTLPDSLETYYQQVGRAGRDGLRADCLLLHARSDLSSKYYFIDQGSEAQKAGRAARLHAMARYAESGACRRKVILPYFGDPIREEPCGFCDNCLLDRDGQTMRDASVLARLFLGCVLETNERFGATHVVNVLRGSRAERVKQWKHDRLPSYGSGNKFSAVEWRELADKFIEAGIVEVEMEHGTLRVTPCGKRVFHGEALLIPEIQAAISAPEEARTEYDPGLFEQLRRLRRAIAAEEAVPPFVVFSDRALMDMAAKFPQTQREFLTVHGVGETKARNYGERFLNAIRSYVSEHGTDRERTSFGADSDRAKRHAEVGEAFNAGRSIAELQAMWGVTRGTILQNLHRYVTEGGAISAERLRTDSAMPEADSAPVSALFQQLGHERLGPVFAALEGQVPYDDLHYLRIIHILENVKGSERSPAE